MNKEKELRELGKGFSHFAKILEDNSEAFAAAPKMTKQEWDELQAELKEARKQRRKDAELIKMSPETFYLKTFTI